MDIHLQSFGSKLRVKEGLFQLRVYNKKEMLLKEDYAINEVDSIYLNVGSTVSVSAIEMALNNDIDVVIMNKFDYPIARINSSKPDSTSLILKAQLWASIGEEGLEWSKTWTVGKCNSMIDHLYKRSAGIPEKSLILDEVQKIEKYRDKIDALDVFIQHNIKDTIRGLEGSASKCYFRALSKMLPETYRFKRRSRRPGKDIFNTALNYGYGLLYPKIEKALFLAGLNPYIGFLHRDGYQFKSLVYDFIEPFRVLVDEVVFQLCKEEKLTAQHITHEDESVLLNRRGKQIMIETFLKAYKSKRQSGFDDKTNDSWQMAVKHSATELAMELRAAFQEEFTS